MTIDEAIKALELDKTCDYEGDQQILVAALQLGIEALERVKDERHPDGWMGPSLLPSEAED